MKTQADPRTQSAFSPTELAERTLHRRAIEAVIWGVTGYATPEERLCAIRGGEYTNTGECRIPAPR